MNFKLLIFLLLILPLQTVLFGQEIKKETAPETKAEKKQEKKHYNLTQFTHETFLFAKQPTKWVGSDWIRLGVVIGVSISFMPLDEKVSKAIAGNQQYYKSGIVIGGKVYGSWYSIGGVAAIYGFYGLFADNDGAKKICVELLQAGIYSEAVSEILKVAVSRDRPLVNDGSFTFHPFTLINDNYHSFPSGHSTSAMALSTVMSRHAPTTFLKILAYVPVAFTIFSRQYQKEHWLTDVIPGAAIGYFTGTWVVDLHEGKRHRIHVASVYPPNITYSFK